MDIAERVKAYRAIEQYRGRPLIAYATSTRVNVPAYMAGDAVREFVDQIQSIEDSGAVDILLHSTGGDALAAWKLMSMIRERFKHVAVLVPFMAFSAATMFALGADEIILHPDSSLGPIDPQIAVRMPEGGIRQFAYEDLTAFLRFLRVDVGLTQERNITEVVDKLFSATDPLTVGAARRASDLSTEVGERLLGMHAANDVERKMAREIATNLNKSFFAHGDAISRSRARSLELQIAKDDPQLENLIWQAYLGIESHMQLRKPFDPLKEFMANPQAAEALKPRAPLNLPPDTPQDVAMAAYNNVMQAAMQAAQSTVTEVPFAVVSALIESPRIASEFRSGGTVSAYRQPDGEVRLIITETESGWRTVPLSSAPGTGVT
jgi:hypothetical protein